MEPYCPVCRSSLELVSAGRVYNCPLCNFTATEFLLIEVAGISLTTVPPEINEAIKGTRHLVEICDYSDPENIEIIMPANFLLKMPVGKSRRVGLYLEKMAKEGKEVILKPGEFKIIKKVYVHRYKISSIIN